MSEVTKTDPDPALRKATEVLDEQLSAKLAEREQAEASEREKLDARIKSLEESLEQYRAKEREHLARTSVPGVEYDKDGDKVGRGFSLARAAELAFRRLKGMPIDDRRYGYELETERAQKEQTRDYNVGTDTAGGVFVPVQVMGDSIIPELEAQAVGRRAGMQSITGLTADLVWPADEGGFSASYIDTEGAEAVTASDNTFGARKATPHTMAAKQRMSHGMMLQGGNFEGFIRGRFGAKFALREDLSLIEGSGSGAEPLGITAVATAQTDLDSVTSATLVKSLNDFVFNLPEANAWDPAGSYAWITTPDVAKAWSGATDADNRRLLQDAGAPAGLLDRVMTYPLFMSTQFNSGSTFAMFGDFSKAISLEWGSMTVRAVETGDDADRLRVSIIGHMSHDLVVVHPEAFVYTNSADVNMAS